MIKIVFLWPNLASIGLLLLKLLLLKPWTFSHSSCLWPAVEWRKPQADQSRPLLQSGSVSLSFSWCEASVGTAWMKLIWLSHVFYSSSYLILIVFQVLSKRPEMSLIIPQNFQHILRVMNTNVDGKRNVMFALTAIKGIGRRYANLVLKKVTIGWVTVLFSLPWKRWYVLMQCTTSKARTIVTSQF